jgi:hypothetical protein
MSNRSSTVQEQLFKDISLKDIFKQDEVDSMIKDPFFADILRGHETSTDSSLRIMKKSNNINLLFDRTKLIIKFLKLSIEKLNSYNENTLARGLEW